MADYNFISPVDDDVKISSFYGIRIDPTTGFGITIHNGLDFACPIGSNVYAAASGKVIWEGKNKSYGNAVIIEHDDGFLTLYAHLQNSDVQSGDYVVQGETIAYSGSTGHSTGPHLHFETIDGNITLGNKPIKDIIKEKNAIIDEEGYKRTGILGATGRYNMYTGQNLNNLYDPTNDKPIKEIEQCSIKLQMCKIPSGDQKYTRETFPSKYYIWHTQKDNKVRSSHAHLDGTIHSIDEDIFPGEEYGCRCWAEEVVSED